jgi:hypothetical protein
MATAYEKIGLPFPERSRAAVTQWASSHEPGAHGRHSYELAQFGLDENSVRESFARYMSTYDAAA